MRLLLDTNILVALAQREVGRLSKPIRSAITSADNVLLASAASLWEIAIKNRLGKLDLALPLAELPDFLSVSGIGLLAIDHRHAVAEANPKPQTRDPFDRLLLAQCEVEKLRLVTTDRVLAAHPAAWLPA